MSKINNSKIKMVAVAVALTSTLTACTFNFGDSDSDRSGGMMGGGMMNNSSRSSEFSASDIMFAQMMIPHHKQAVEMSTLAETRALSPEVKTLAKQIKEEQAPEIEQMTKWLTDSNSPMEMGHDMGMNGMLSDEQMQELEAATGADFDTLYLKGMIEHHNGAIQMAQMVVNSNNAEAKALGEAIISSQTKQIKYMESLLSK